MKDIIILAIETSCDETSAAVVKNGHEVLSNIIYSQIKIHEKFGGVVPEIASRNHINKISEVVDEAIEKSNLNFSDITAIAVTKGPGLVGALLTGLSYAKGLAFVLNKPLLGINHIEGHIMANYITNKDFTPPYICLVVSGGHTNIILVNDYGKYKVLGKTLDDAVGEAYDKVARGLNLSYPGGPKIDALAQNGDPEYIKFPRVYLEEGSLNFSFSGIKSSVLNHINKTKMKNDSINAEDIAASFQRAVVEVLVNKTIYACEINLINRVAIVGGVSCNSELRRLMSEQCLLKGLQLNIQKNIYCTDNAAMVGASGYFKYINNMFDALSLNALPSLSLDEY